MKSLPMWPRPKGLNQGFSNYETRRLVAWPRCLLKKYMASPTRTPVYTATVATMAVPWLWRLAAGLPPRSPGFDPGSVDVGFVVDKVALGQVFPEYFPLSVSFHRCSTTWKRTNNNNHLNHRGAQKALSCGASVASAAGPFTEKKPSWQLQMPLVYETS
jgi:hypothetical protein